MTNQSTMPPPGDPATNVTNATRAQLEQLFRCCDLKSNASARMLFDAVLRLRLEQER